MSKKELIDYPIGVTSSETTFSGLIYGNYHDDLSEGSLRLALISGISGTSNDSSLFEKSLDILCERTDVNQFIAADLENVGNSISNASYPPSDGYFFDDSSPESRYLWRWLTMEAPDLVIEVCDASTSQITKYDGSTNDDSFLSALSRGEGQTPGSIPGIRISCTTDTIEKSFNEVVDNIFSSDTSHSEARIELNKRSERSPIEVAKILGAVYGYKLDQPVNYVQGVAVSGRLRLKSLDDSYPDPNDDISKLVSFLTTDEGYEGNDRSGPNLAAMCWAGELAESTGDNKWNDLLIKVANTYERVERGTAPKPCDPVFGCEDMFFISAMCGRAYKLTGDSKYLDSYTDFLLEANVQQENGLFWHSRNAPFFWGRGNGFAALAYAEGISYLPENNPAKNELIEIHSNQMEGLKDLQQPTGMWTQLLDFDGTYQEMSVTSMVGYALARGIRRGWLKEELRPVLDKAWDGVKKRISNDAGLVDVCTGTGFQESRESYLYRAAEYGYDDRGGSMAIWFATEMEKLQRSDS